MIQINSRVTQNHNCTISPLCSPSDKELYKWWASSDTELQHFPTVKGSRCNERYITRLTIGDEALYLLLMWENSFSRSNEGEKEMYIKRIICYSSKNVYKHACQHAYIKHWPFLFTLRYYPIASSNSCLLETAVDYLTHFILYTLSFSTALMINNNNLKTNKLMDKLKHFISYDPI